MSADYTAYCKPHAVPVNMEPEVESKVAMT